ncbi:MAG: AmmeMemoRadiSam system radical SAM enzyme [Clostridiales Family XIII bacterium]|jgi:pyruvate formate lyase activating enzyme|nr:AmmeMemoRadiSam system radical SAM enzyme [Clostridiales Family XIII bacterium]
MMAGGVVCDLCPQGCRLAPGQVGRCRARIGAVAETETRIGAPEGTLSLNYGKLTSASLDSIEKKPLSHFHPGSKILSVGSFGCNLSCPFCQNHRISMAGAGDLKTEDVTPEELAAEAERLVPAGNIGLAFTYNEPLIGYEFVIDTAKQIKDRGLKTVLVTNGYLNRKYWEQILPLTDAMNIDLKAFGTGFYKNIGGDLEIVKDNIKSAAALCHIELTTLVIENENDGDEEMAAMCGFIAEISPEIPLHLSRFFPQYHYADRRPTPIGTLRRLEKIAKEKLKFVELGNVW